jgi:hypothetical protein
MNAKSFLKCLWLAVATVLLCACPGKDPNEPDGPDKPGKVDVTSVSLSPDEIKLGVGATTTLTATVLPEDASDKSLKWSSSDTAVATVSDGVVTAVAPGNATISVITNDGGFTANCMAIVYGKDLITEENTGGSGEGNGYTYTYGDNTVQVNDEIASKMKNLSEEGFDIDIKDLGESTITTYNVFIFPPSDTFPDGFPGKVTNFYEEGGTLHVTMEPAALDDIFENLSLSMTDIDINDHLLQVIDEDGNVIPMTKASGGFTLNMPSMLGIAANISPVQGFTITPNFTVSFKLSIDCEISWFKLKSFHARVENSSTLDLDLAGSCEGTKNLFKSKTVIFPFGAIPVGPLVVSPTITARLVADATGSVAVTTHLHFYLGNYAQVEYTEAGGLYSELGYLKEPEPQEMLTINGALSGGVAVGADIGVGLSAYYKALTIVANLKPRINATFVSSVPFSPKTLTNLYEGTGLGMAFSQAYFEPSLSLQFGGSAVLLGKWDQSFTFPGNLSYSLDKKFIIPALGNKFEYSVRGRNATFTTSMKNKAYYNKNVFINLKYRVYDPERPGVVQETKYKRVDLEPQGDMPKKEGDSVELKGVVSGLTPDTYYEIEGPYITVDAFGASADIAMYPYQNFDRLLHVDPAAEYPIEQVRAILRDIYASRKGEWEGCNWLDNEALSFAHVSGNKEHVSISIPLWWNLNDNLKVANHDPSFTWDLSIQSENTARTFSTVEIEDVKFTGMNPVATKRLVLHSPLIHSVLLSTDDNGTDAPDYVDLSGTSIEQFLHWADVKDALILNECPNLKYLEYSGDGHQYYPQTSLRESYPSELRFGDCKDLDMSFLEATSMIFPLISFTGCSGALKVADYARAFKFEVKNSFTDLIFENNTNLDSDTFRIASYSGGSLSAENLVVTGAPSKEISISVSSVNSVAVHSCPNLKSLDVVGYQSNYAIDFSGVPELTFLSVGGTLDGLVPSCISSFAAKAGTTVNYPRKYYYHFRYAGEGTFSQNNPKYPDPEKRSREFYYLQTMEHGYYYGGEPSRHYHCNPAWEKENSNYPNR